MKPNLKKVSYDNRLQATLVLIWGILICGMILHSILTQSLPKSDSIVIGTFVCGVALLIGGVWLLLGRKKGTTVININGWQYNSFLKGNKYVFILLSGCRTTLFIACILIGLYSLDLLHLNETFTWEKIAFLAILFIFLIILSGYVAYRKYKSMKFIE
jgi:hypothetical protein